MDIALILGIVTNAILMFSLGLVYIFTPTKKFKQGSFNDSIKGLIIGVVVVIVMLVPFKLGNGVVLDTRSIVISLTGFFFGFIPMVLTVLFASIFRIIQGGSGALTGVMVIVTSGSLGYIFRAYFYEKIKNNLLVRSISLYLFGLLVHIVMLIMFLFLPSDVRYTIIKLIYPYVLLFYPIFTLLLGALMFMKTDLKMNIESLSKTTENFEKAIDSAPIPMTLHDEDGIILKVNSEWTNLSGYTIEDMPNSQEWAKIAFGKIAERAHLKISEAYEDKDRTYQSNVLVKTKSDELRTWDFHTSYIGYLDNGKKGYLSIALDVTEKNETTKKLEYLSFHDELTGLYNRRFFEIEVERLNTKRNYPISILVGDINGLKIVNDSFGHFMGDELIKETAEVLRLIFRSDDILSRIGGDEFVVLLPQTSETEAEELINRINIALEDRYVETLKLSISFGYGVIDENNKSYEQAFIDAENRMYQNKLLESPSIRGLAIDTILSTLFEIDVKTRYHSENVSKLATILAQELKLSASKIQEIKTAALLHDIGKIVTPINILNKLITLDIEEFDEIKKHPEIGFRILSSGHKMENVANIVLYHHERFDGGGYPNQSLGEEIPLGSRIIAVVDAFDAMTTERNYKPVLSVSEAITELRNNKGTQFDPTIVDAFINVVISNNKKTGK